MSFLIQRAKTDPQAFLKLYDLYLPVVYQYVASRVASTVEAEELTSAVWEQALLHIQELRSEHPVVFKAWLLKIAANLIKKNYADREKHPLDLEAVEGVLPASEPTPLEAERSREEAVLLRRLVESLPVQQQEVVRLRYLCGFRNKEIAAFLELSEKTVASHLLRGLDFLRLAYQKLQ